MGIRVLLVDDHTLVRAGLRVLISSLPNIESVMESSNGEDAFEKLKAFHPDIILTDIQMPKLSGLELLSKLKQNKVKSRVIVISMYSNEEYILRALNYGASGYLLKDAGPHELELAIGAAMKGETYMDSRIATKVTDYMRRTGITESPLDRLTQRQREVLTLVVQGLTTKDIAQVLNLSVKTIEAYRSQIMEILNIYDIPGLVRFALRHGLIEINDSQ
jgi:DNA-binding NarL/FixJ family response regulator